LYLKSNSGGKRSGQRAPGLDNAVMSSVSLPTYLPAWRSGLAGAISESGLAGLSWRCPRVPPSARARSISVGIGNAALWPDPHLSNNDDYKFRILRPERDAV